MCISEDTFGIFITKCPVTFERSAAESVVLTSSGKANCRTYRRRVLKKDSLEKFLLFL